MIVLSDRSGECGPEKDCCRRLMFRKPEWRSSSESNDLVIVE